MTVGASSMDGALNVGSSSASARTIHKESGALADLLVGNETVIMALQDAGWLQPLRGGCCSGWGDHNVVHGPKKAQRTMPLMKEADDGGRWAVRRIMAVRRHEGRRGRPLDVLVEWEGEDSDGDLWEESWVSVTFLSKDLRQEARRLEAELFGSGSAAAAPAPSRRAARREAIRQRQERERDLQQWRARLRDRARGRVHDRD